MKYFYLKSLIFMFILTSSFATMYDNCPKLMPKNWRSDEYGGIRQLPAVTAHNCRELSGAIIKDKKIPFEGTFPNKAYWYKGIIYSRVVCSQQTKDLHFYYSIEFTEVSTSIPNDELVRNIIIYSFSTEKGTWVGYRTDGVGSKDWCSAKWAYDSPNHLQIDGYWQEVSGIHLADKGIYYKTGIRSRLVVVKTTAKEFSEDGEMDINSWASGYRLRIKGICIPKY